MSLPLSTSFDPHVLAAFRGIYPLPQSSAPEPAASISEQIAFIARTNAEALASCRTMQAADADSLREVKAAILRANEAGDTAAAAAATNAYEVVGKRLAQDRPAMDAYIAHLESEPAL